jgi:hypothetical protein
MKKAKKVSEIATPEGKEWLRSVLQSEIVTVTFEKLDGTTRKMRCTLIENKIPDESKPKNSGKLQSDDAIAVFDLEKQDWRSFRFDSVRRIEFTLSEGM